MGVVMGHGPKSGPAKTGPAVPLATPMVYPLEDPPIKRGSIIISKTANARRGIVFT